ncbi:MAG: hypothetical protein AAGC70_10950 [Pseudomonadota bacterium]
MKSIATTLGLVLSALLLLAALLFGAAKHVHAEDIWLSLTSQKVLTAPGGEIERR